MSQSNILFQLTQFLLVSKLLKVFTDLILLLGDRFLGDFKIIKVETPGIKKSNLFLLPQFIYLFQLTQSLWVSELLKVFTDPVQQVDDRF